MHIEIGIVPYNLMVVGTIPFFKVGLYTAVDFRKWLRFPRGAAGASSASPAESPPSAISLRSLRLLLQSTAMWSIIQYINFLTYFNRFSSSALTSSKPGLPRSANMFTL